MKFIVPIYRTLHILEHGHVVVQAATAREAWQHVDAPDFNHEEVQWDSDLGDTVDVSDIEVDIEGVMPDVAPALIVSTGPEDDPEADAYHLGRGVL